MTGPRLRVRVHLECVVVVVVVVVAPALFAIARIGNRSAWQEVTMD